MIKEWYIQSRLREFSKETGVVLSSWQALKKLSELKQIIVPSALMFYRGEPLVRQFFAVEDQTLATKQRVLQVAGSLARTSTLPVMKAIARTAEESELPLREIDGDSVGEAGIVGKLDRTWFVLGDTATMADEAIELGVTIQTLAHQFELDGKFTVFLAQKQPKRLLGIFACEYELQPGVTEAIQNLRSIGVELVLLTAAKTSIAKGLGNRLALSLIHSELTNTDKERVLTSLVAQQPQSAVLGTKGGGVKVQRILIGKGDGRGSTLAFVPDLETLSGVIQKARSMIKDSQRSPLWRNL